MTDKPDVEKWVNTAARALALRSGVNFDKLPRESNREVWRSDARACLSAAHRAAAADGFRLVRVPDEPTPIIDVIMGAYRTGAQYDETWTDLRAELLASAVEVGE